MKEFRICTPPVKLKPPSSGISRLMGRPITKKVRSAGTKNRPREIQENGQLLAGLFLLFAGKAAQHENARDRQQEHRHDQPRAFGPKRVWG